PAPQPTAVEAQALPLLDKPSVAVLPFANLSNDPQQAYFADGIAEDLMTDLSRLSGLFVIARHSAIVYNAEVVLTPSFAFGYPLAWGIVRRRCHAGAKRIVSTAWTPIAGQSSAPSQSPLRPK